MLQAPTGKGQPGVREEVSGAGVRGVDEDEVRSQAGGAHEDGEELGFYCMRIHSPEDFEQETKMV